MTPVMNSDTGGDGRFKALPEGLRQSGAQLRATSQCIIF